MDKELEIIRVKHATLSALYHHISTYLDCARLNYFGEKSNKEIHLQEMLTSLEALIHEVMWDYYQKESMLME
jgi:hypothetical protein